jgi:hypothetical protein
MLLRSVRQRHRRGGRLPALRGSFRGSHLETLHRAVRKSQPTRPPRPPLLRELRLLPDHLARARARRQEPLLHHLDAGMNFRNRVSRHHVQQQATSGVEDSGSSKSADSAGPQKAASRPNAPPASGSPGVRSSGSKAAQKEARKAFVTPLGATVAKPGKGIAKGRPGGSRMLQPPEKGL